MLLGGGALSAQPPQDPQDPSIQNAPQQTWSPQQLDDLVAPIALYPDQLMSQVLVASTYPLEVVEAQQWIQRNSGLKGTQLMDAARQQNWDASVQALVAFPDVLARLNQDVRWTTELGNAFLAQQADVMAAVQRMRARAQANGRLSSTPQQTVSTETQDGQAAIQIQPTNPEVVYVPYYDPAYVWGPPAYGYYPSLYYPSFGFGYWPGIDVGLYFGGWGGYGWGGWGWGPNWFGRSVFVNYSFFNRYGYRGGFYGRSGFGGRTVWAHDPGHRLGVTYPTRQLAGRFGSASLASRSARFGGAGGSSFQGSRMSNGSSYGGSRYQSRGYQSGGQRFGSAPQSSAPNVNRGGFGGSRNYGGSVPNSPRNNFNGSTPSAPRNNFNGGAPRSYNGGGYQGGGQQYRSAPQPSAPAPNMNRGFGGGSRNYGGSAPSAPRNFTPSAPRNNFNGGAPRSFGGGGFNGGGSAPRSFSAPSAPRSFGGGGGAPRSFSAPSAPRSFGGGGGGGGGARSSGGGGHHR